MGGKPAAALAITDRAYERGADLGVDAAGPAGTGAHADPAEIGSRHCATARNCPRPNAPAAPPWPTGCRVPALARAWQMLLKGVGEVETAPDRRAAAEMVLIRLCHVADLPPPGDLVRRLTTAGGGDERGKDTPSPLEGGGWRQGAGSPKSTKRYPLSPEGGGWAEGAASPKSTKDTPPPPEGEGWAEGAASPKPMGARTPPANPLPQGRGGFLRNLPTPPLPTRATA